MNAEHDGVEFLPRGRGPWIKPVLVPVPLSVVHYYSVESMHLISSMMKEKRSRPPID